MSFLLLFSTISLTFILSSALTPLTLGIWILLLAFLTSLTAANLISSWFGFIIFLIYIGGLLVMFAYFSAITPNQQLQLKLSLSFFILFLTFLMINSDLFYATNTFNSMTTTPASLPITTLLTTQNIPLFLTMGTVLFLALVAVVKISRSSTGPLRPFL